MLAAAALLMTGGFDDDDIRPEAPDQIGDLAQRAFSLLGTDLTHAPVDEPVGFFDNNVAEPAVCRIDGENSLELSCGLIHG